jgi:hypothetical protein
MKGLLQAITDWGFDAPLRWDDDRFDALARDVVAHQYESVAPYRRFCDNRGVTPDTLQSWLGIPAVPTDVFKRVRLTAVDPDDVVRTFQTSGTTVGDRGAHYFGTLDYYRAAISAPFRRFCLPDRRRIPMLVLAPTPGEAPDSSLSFMLGELVQQFGHPLYSGFFVTKDDEGELGFEFDGFVEAMEDAPGPVMVLGTAFAFVEFFEQIDLSFDLPEGSRVMETGGLKGKTREVSRDELYGWFADRLGIAADHCIAEYSMTELSSQAYTDALSRSVSWSESRFVTPPWARVVAVDPESLEPVEPGERGLLRWYDLANVDSVVAVQTSDVGVVGEDGRFELFGRASGAQLRGCSLTVEEIVAE